MFQVNKTQQEILQLFLDIPEKTVKFLYNKVEVFISTLQLGDEDEMHSEAEEIAHDNEKDELEQSFVSKKKRKKFKTSSRSNKQYLFLLCFSILIIEGFFIFNYFLSTSAMNSNT